MGRSRSVPPVMYLPAHDGVKRCVMMTHCTIHTIALVEGCFAAIVHSRDESDVAAVAILDRDDIAEHIRLLLNAIEDGERIESGLIPLHGVSLLKAIDDNGLNTALSHEHLPKHDVN
ncbi:MAG TPA: hypothetical protein VFW22_16320 [Pseudolabrys sp.]|nr:hypothetical protein [Pseudolabrys sp.]